ncbi:MULTISPECIES: hypothetical protein [unclassified Variovorax]|uniref:hypothetical protein n=1 Tax=unclassified Variovorax TaxID=663243 RepID=UPI001BD32FCE|nr:MULTISPECIES: hypothetical protein [unclassified Variovorax]
MIDMGLCEVALWAQAKRPHACNAAANYLVIDATGSQLAFARSSGRLIRGDRDIDFARRQAGAGCEDRTGPKAPQVHHCTGLMRFGVLSHTNIDIARAASPQLTECMSASEHQDSS